MKVEAKRVKCGDCIVITENNEKLIIDCGSDNRHNQYSCGEFAYHQLEMELRDDTNKQLLITHFDKDHYNGILEINDHPSIFYNTYIPMSIVKENETLLESFSQIVFLANDNSWGIKLTSGIVNLFRKLFSITSGSIIPVKKGDIITYNGHKMNVLWPEVDKIVIGSSTIAYQLYKNRDDILKILAGRLSEVSDDPNNSNSSLVEEIREAMDEMKNSLVYVQESPDSKNIERLNSAYQELRGLHNRLGNQISSHYLMYLIYDQYLYAYHALINSMNATSVILEDEQNALFLGDAPAEIIRYLRNNKDIKNHYKLVKLQHHATASYVTSATPSADYYIVSNGGRIRRQISGDFINGLCGNSREILCTNGRDDAMFCEFRYNNGGCHRKCSGRNVVNI